MHCHCLCAVEDGLHFIKAHLSSKTIAKRHKIVALCKLRCFNVFICYVVLGPNPMDLAASPSENSH